MINTKELNDRILRLGMIDTARNSMIALPLVMLFEIYMIISWIINVDDKSEASSVIYLIGYIIMFVFTAIILAFIQHNKKKIDQTYRKISYMQHFLAFVYMLWAVSFTYVGSVMRGNFDILIFITFLTVLPLFCYLNSSYWVVLQLISTVALFYIASYHDRFFAFCVNFTVFTIISILAGWTMHHIRRFGYQRQIELEEERNIAHDLAYKDSLTGLPNRQSCNDEFERLKTDQRPEDIIILMCDVNGLKPINDQLGHKAGDELLQGAAYCLQQAFQDLGTIYRVGGDEFTGILHGTEQQLRDAVRKLEWSTSNWEGPTVKHLSISIGYATVHSNPSATLQSLQTQADNAMYEAKRNYYQQKKEGTL